MDLLRTLVAALCLGVALSVSAGEVVDINTADARALAEAIEGVGERKAAAIVADRERHGPFRSVDDLARVSGIGPRTVDQNRARLTVGDTGQ